MADLLRPQPLDPVPDLRRIDGNAHYRQVEEWLTQGRQVCITDTYGTALTLYAWLKRSVRRRRPVQDYRTGRLYRELLWQLTRPLLVPIAGHALALKRAPAIPWLARLYPERADFLLPLPEVLGLNGSWQWYTRGVSYSCLPYPLHPFHGVHFTTRDEHLRLFAAYLAGRPSLPGLAVDVGTGAGPLTFLMLQHGVARVEATDTNPNALASLGEDLARQQLQDRVDLALADLVPGGPPVEMIACNPPWVPGGQHVAVDAGSHYAPDFFPRLFAATAARLAPGGRLVLLFSNLGQITGLEPVSPVATELESGGRYRLLECREQAAAPATGERTPDWQRQLRQQERLQLWELERC